MVAYSKIDFGDLILSKNLDESILLNIKKSDMITHTFPNIDRCCKVNELNGRNIEYDGIDNLDRIRCDISKNEFLEKYVRKSQPVMMLGCQDGWKAKNWSAEYLLDKYNNSLIWECAYAYECEYQNYNMVGRGDRYLMLSNGGSGILLIDIETLQHYEIHCDIATLTLAYLNRN